ncbi:MAG: C4-dicarboxylate ABC transporter, partial [Synergistaceae bacterium]|nr:C4-dicarboxylate ABC transporter [Synergistaceae bacterium]
MNLAVVALIFLLAAIVLGFVRKMNVGLVCLGLAFILGRIGNVPTRTILGGFPGNLFLTLLGTMFFFSLLQENNTLELLSKKIVSLVGTKTFLIPVIIYAASFILSAAGPGAISVQAVMIIFAVSLSVQMNASPILMGGMAILGAVGGTASPIALTGILVRDLTAGANITGLDMPVFIGVSVVNFICAVVLYIVYGGYKLRSDSSVSTGVIPAFNGSQKICTLALLAMI